MQAHCAGRLKSAEGGGIYANNVLAESLTDLVDDPNIVPVKTVNLENIPTPWAIITPDGKWQAAGEPDWFGTARIDDPGWDKTARNILQQHGDKILVVVECQS